jgi:hypothetical protein
MKGQLLNLQGAMIAVTADITLLARLFWEKSVYLKHDKGGLT